MKVGTAKHDSVYLLVKVMQALLHNLTGVLASELPLLDELDKRGARDSLYLDIGSKPLYQRGKPLPC
jgi:hypothetical protein